MARLVGGMAYIATWWCRSSEGADPADDGAATQGAPQGLCVAESTLFSILHRARPAIAAVLHSMSPGERDVLVSSVVRRATGDGTLEPKGWAEVAAHPLVFRDGSGEIVVDMQLGDVAVERQLMLPCPEKMRSMEVIGRESVGRSVWRSEWGVAG